MWRGFSPGIQFHGLRRRGNCGDENKIYWVKYSPVCNKYFSSDILNNDRSLKDGLLHLVRVKNAEINEFQNADRTINEKF